MELLIGGNWGFPEGCAVPGRPQPYLPPAQKAALLLFHQQIPEFCCVLL